MKFAVIWPLVKKSATQFWNRKGPRLGAALAFYTALSISPLLLVVISIAGAAYGEQAARGELAQQMEDTVGQQGADAIQAILASQQSRSQGIVMTIIGVVTLLVSATTVFGQLQGAIDTIWDVDDRKVGGGIWGAIKDRLLSFSVVGVLALLLLASLVFSAVVSALGSWFQEQLGIGSWVFEVGNALLAFALTVALFAIIFKVLPHAHPSWSDVWLGALVTAVLFTVGKFLLSLYFGQTAPGSAYGAAGSFVVLLIWVYYSAQILLLGAEFTHVYAHTEGTGRDRDLRDTAKPSRSPSDSASDPNKATRNSAPWTGPDPLARRLQVVSKHPVNREDPTMIDTPVADGTRQPLAPQTEPTLTELVSGIANDAQRLMKQQYQMFRAELREDIRRTKSAVIYLGFGAALAALGGLFLLVALPLLVAWGLNLPQWAGWAIVGGVLLVVGVIGLLVGRQIFVKNNPLPDKTLNALEENLSWIANHRS